MAYLAMPSRNAAGDIPYIVINWGETLPPINRLSTVENPYYYESNPQDSTISLEWKIKEEGYDHSIYIQRYSHNLKLNDPMLLEQYPLYPEIAQQIVDFVCKDHYSEKNPTLRINGILSIEEVPEYLKPLVNQILTWQKTLKSLEFLQQFYATGIDEGYYILRIAGYQIAVPDESGNYDYFETLSALKIDPEEFPIHIEEDCVWWEYPKDAKMKILLALSDSDDKTSKYYGYLEKLQEFRKKQEQRKIQEEEERKRYTQQLQQDSQELEIRRQKLLHELIPQTTNDDSETEE